MLGFPVQRRPWPLTARTFLISAFQEGCDMPESQSAKIDLELSLGERVVQVTIDLQDSGASLPFIARYRREATGNLDEPAIPRIHDLLYRLKKPILDFILCQFHIECRAENLSGSL
jgi:hypothetical protein